MKLLAVCGALFALPTGVRAEEKAETFKVVYEVFSLPMTEAAAILRSGIEDQEIYNKMVEGVRGQKVNLETFMVGRSLNTQIMTIEQIVEYIYNTSTIPPVIPAKFTYIADPREGTVGMAPKPFFPMIPTTPKDFDTKNTGKTLELEATLSADRNTIDLGITPTQVDIIKSEYFGQGASKVEMPRFGVQKIKTGLTIPEGKPSFLGATSPPDSLQPKKDEKRIWYSFITITLISL